MIKLKNILLEEYNFEIKPFNFEDAFSDETNYEITYDGDRYGVIISSDDEEYISNPKTFYIKYIEIFDDAKRMGAFYTVMKKIVELAKSYGYKYIELEADTSSGIDNYKKLEQLYKMYGFNIVGKKKNKYGTSLIKKI